ncbi:MAG: ACP S-malonyltransferase [Anaerolineaceae bacterium]|nr:ACP S-malonyltransferase [Anaerolineaceae bacterium]
MDWTKAAFVFPGQGSQMVGMAKDLAETYPVARQTLEQADEILGFALSDLCFNGPEDSLNDTYNTQPALYTAGIATLRVLQAEMPGAVPGFAAGHSLGEFTALAAVGAVSFEDGLRLVRERGRLMKAAGTQSPGAMAAVLGLDASVVREVCIRASQQTGGVLILANDNCPGQNVISGDDATLEVGMRLLEEAKAKRVVKLPISIAAHSPLMESASAEFRQVLANTEFTSPRVPVYGNVDAQPLAGIDGIRHELDLQLTRSVRWTESVQAMVTAGAEVFIELGPKDVLTGLLKRIDRSKSGKAINGVEALQKFVAEA